MHASLVGNSSEVLDTGFGSQIDRLPVYRINAAPVKPYANDVGFTTEARFINPLLQAGNTHPSTSTPENWISTLSGSRLILKPSAHKQGEMKTARELAGEDNVLIRATGLSEAYNDIGTDEITTGVFAAWWLLNKKPFKRVHCYGFGFYSGGGHYFEDVGRKAGQGHDLELEREWMENNDNIKLWKG